MTNEETGKESKRMASQRGNEGEFEYVLYSTEAGEAIGVTTSTVRKYSMALEDGGYKIMRNEQKKRMYTDSDLAILRQMLKYVKGGLSVEKAAKASAGESKGEDRQVATPEIEEIGELKQVVGRQSELLERQNEALERQNELISQLSDRLDKQERRAEERDQNVMQALNESLETRKQLAASENEQKQPKRKGLFGWLFGGKGEGENDE